MKENYCGPRPPLQITQPSRTAQCRQPWDASSALQRCHINKNDCIDLQKHIQYDSFPCPYPRRFQVYAIQHKARASKQDDLDAGFLCSREGKALDFP